MAKVWKAPDDAKARKLDALLQLRPSVPQQAASRVQMAWPQQALYDSQKKTIGFAMPRAERSRYREFVRYSVPSARGALEKELGASIGERELLGIARNVAEAFELVHANGCLIGDVNHTNFLVSPDTSVFLIDVDSMQVTDESAGEVYRCEVGTADFTPPRLIGKRLSDIDRIPDDDRFGLAVLIFQLLMEGNHPYDQVDSAGSSESGNARLENIKRGHSPYTAMLNEHAEAWLTASEIPDPTLRQRMQQHILVLIEGDSDTDYTALIDHRATAWLELSSELQDLFRRAFPNDQANGSPSRPTPREWIEALEEAGAVVMATYPAVARSLPARAAGANARSYLRQGIGTGYAAGSPNLVGSGGGLQSAATQVIGGSPGLQAAGTSADATMAPIGQQAPGTLLHLDVIAGPAAGTSFNLQEGNNVLGRAPDNEMFLDDAMVSRAHAMFRVEGRETLLVDLGSTGGTRVGDRQVEGHPLSLNQTITVGQSVMVLLSMSGVGAPSGHGGATMMGTPGIGMALVAQSGPDSGKIFSLREGPNIVGRDASADVQVSDHQVSRRHAVITVKGDRVTASDIGSSYGTVINGQNVEGSEAEHRRSHLRGAI